MKMRSSNSLSAQQLIFIVGMFSLTATKALAACTGQGTYEVKFTGLWTASSHPKDYPSHPHWSGLVGGSHNSKYQMWVAGGTSTLGMKNIAEFGKNATLLNEMRAQGSNVLGTLALQGISSGTGTGDGSLDVDGSHSLVSLVSMVAPSPDWFVGVHDLDLCNGTTWTQSMTVDLFPYDAGTDSGLKFNSNNSATNPQERIHLLTATNPNNSQSSFFGGVNLVQRFASLELSLQSVSTVPPPRASQQPLTSCPGNKTYNVNFTTMWTAASHPKDYPAGDAHWSGLVGGSHNSEYRMWTRGGMSTPGMEMMAEFGKQPTLLDEMKKEGNRVLQTIALSGIGSGSGYRRGNLLVDSDHSYVSLVSMIAPSPDWFVGIHDVDLCDRSTFKWRETVIIKLLPYDAGTDNGLKFRSDDDDTQPKAQIHLLTGTMPNNSDSSFYGYDPVPPMATMTITLGAGESSGNNCVAGEMIIIISIMSMLVLSM